jgi:hypothetical protein
MARAARATSDESDLIGEPVIETVTYVPGPEDKTQAVWCGHTFVANVPKEIKGHANGTEREKLNAGLIEAARNNPRFVVGSAKPRRDAKKDPVTAEEYRSYFVEWLKLPHYEHAEDLIARLAKDREMQMVCQIGTDDFDFMAALFMPKLHEFAKRDELNDAQLGAVWLRHGYNTLPWQIG